MGAGARHRRRHQAGEVRRLPEGGRRRGVDASAGRVAEQLLDLTKGQGVDVVVDYVSATATLEAGAKALGRRGRLVTLGGSGKPFSLSAADLLNKEQDVLGSRYVTRSEVLDLLDLVRAAKCSRSSRSCVRWRRRRPCTNWSSAAR